ncbi:outer membrane lipoprotein OprI [Pseudomonas sp. REP124]|uniref:Lpp/OprI family alanine-zipper lipoprotein n=1 Tax=Pseudomonas sp. REP124 TaxID=2875731 RepID=UPI001CD0358C|nr:Lpp/OprI family alanine-zipper lipoprotein [Pseudomonas sp. REP124]MBZ9783663.1 outer membrane lipoprotein OprI [Pseudomonas sp. REP124]
MSRYFTVAVLNILLATTAGCSHQHAQEIDARLESAESNAAWARLRADEAYLKAELAAEIAVRAHHTADEADVRNSWKK